MTFLHNCSLLAQTRTISKLVILFKLLWRLRLLPFKVIFLSLLQLLNQFLALLHQQVLWFNLIPLCILILRKQNFCERDWFKFSGTSCFLTGRWEPCYIFKSKNFSNIGLALFSVDILLVEWVIFEFICDHHRGLLYGWKFAISTLKRFLNNLIRQLFNTLNILWINTYYILQINFWLKTTCSTKWHWRVWCSDSVREITNNLLFLK